VGEGRDHHHRKPRQPTLNLCTNQLLSLLFVTSLGSLNITTDAFRMNAEPMLHARSPRAARCTGARHVMFTPHTAGSQKNLAACRKHPVTCARPDCLARMSFMTSPGHHHPLPQSSVLARQNRIAHNFNPCKYLRLQIAGNMLLHGTIGQTMNIAHQRHPEARPLP